MGKKKRNKKTTVYGVIEGKITENNFLGYLQEVYHDPTITSVQIDQKHGGTPDSLVSRAITYAYNFNKVFVWIDEDKDLKKREKLADCWRVNSEDREGFLVAF